MALRDDGIAGWIDQGYTRGTHAQLLPMITAAIAAGLGAELDPSVVWMTLQFWAILLTVGTYSLARCFGTPLFAVATAALTQCCPVLVTYQRVLYPQLAMAPLVVCALAALVRTGCFVRSGVSIVLGFWTGMATLAKVIAPVYLAGSAVAALILGLRSPPRRWRVIANVALAAIASGALVGPWLLGGWQSVLGYTNAVVGDGPRIVPLTSPDRWLYYPLNLVNNGFGFPLAILVLAAAGRAIWTIARRTRESAPRDDGAALRNGMILTAGVLVSWIVITMGQVAGYSQYVMSWIPLGAILLLHQWRAIERPAWRALAALVIVLAAAWGLGISMRSFADDRIRGEWKGIQVIGATDLYLSPLARGARALPQPEAEPWPVAEYAERILEFVPDRAPNVATLHPFLCGPNLTYEALRRHRRRMIEIQIPWAAVLGGAANTDMSFLASLDSFAVDPRMLDPADVSKAVLRWEVRCDVVDRRFVAPEVEVCLIALRRLWERPPVAPEAVLDSDQVRKADVRFGSGLGLRGVELRRPPMLEGREVLHLFFTGAGEAGDRLAIRVVDAAGVAVASHDLPAPSGPLAAGTLAVVTSPWIDARGRSRPLSWRVFLESSPERGARPRSIVSASVLASGMEISHDQVVLRP